MPVLANRIVREGLGFFDAVEVLAEFERGEKEIGSAPVGQSPAEMGWEHFQAFAEREGIAFDTAGKPHPTLEGEIVTAGTFMQDALDRARAFYRQRPDELQKAARENAGILMPIALENTAAHMEAILGDAQKLEHVKWFIGKFDEHLECLTTLLENDLDFSAAGTPSHLSFFDFSNKDKRLDVFEDFLAQLRVTERLLHAKGYYRRKTSGGDTDENYCDRDVNEAAKIHVMARPGAAEKDWNAAAQWIMDGQPLEMPPFIPAFRKLLEEMVTQMEKSLRMNKRAAEHSALRAPRVRIGGGK